MPYIKRELRKQFRPTCSVPNRDEPGNLNYQITELLRQFVALNGTSYTTFNAALGAIEGAKLEFYRRVVVPYEEEKMKENGDVY